MTKEEAINVLEQLMGIQIGHFTDAEMLTALDMAVDALRWNPNWISVEDGLPKPHFCDTSSDWVLICTKQGGIFIDSYNHKHQEWINNRSNVSHWMPLPPAPRKEDKK